MARYAILVNANPDDAGPVRSGLAYALDLDDAGDQVRVFFDGSATEWIALLDEPEGHSLARDFEEVRDRGLLGGACGSCAEAFGVYEEVDEAGVDLLGDRETHGPDVGELVDDGWELLTVG